MLSPNARNQKNKQGSNRDTTDFNKPVGMEFIDLANALEKAFKHKVDVVSKNGLREKYYKAIEYDIVYV